MSRNNLSEFYDNLYSENKNTFGGGKHDPFIEKLSGLLSVGAKILDVGAGQGRNAFFLAKQGFQVDTIDISEEGTRQIQKQAEAENVTIHAKTLPIESADIEIEHYDTIMFMSILHHLPYDDALRILQHYQDRSKPGCVHLIKTFTSEGDFYELPKNKDMFYPIPDTLKVMYQDWKILEYYQKQQKTRATHPDGTPMENLTDFLITQKYTETLKAKVS